MNSAKLSSKLISSMIYVLVSLAKLSNLKITIKDATIMKTRYYKQCKNMLIILKHSVAKD